MRPDHGPAAYTADRIFDGERTLTGHAVIVADGVVSAVAPLDALPPGVVLHREPGTSLIPGLIDTHIHFMRWEGPLFLAHGVTTVRDTGNELKWILDRRSEWKDQPWPRVLSLGPLLDGPVPIHEFVARSCKNQDDAVAAVREMIAAKVDGIKFYAALPPEWFAAMVSEAHAAGLKVSMHCAGAGVLVAGEAGVDEFYHLDGILADIWPDHPPSWLDVWGYPGLADTWDRQREVADRIAALGMTSTPTLAYWDSQWRARIGGYLQTEELRPVPAEFSRWQAEVPDRAMSDLWRRALDNALKFQGLLLERGVPTLAGTDAPCGPIPPGLSLWREMSLLVECGMSPMQALRSATSDAADFLGRPELGRLRPGAAADMVFVGGNPMERIPEKPGVTMVLRRGQAYRPDQLISATPVSVEDLQEDPWHAQFKLHWSRRPTAAQAIPDRS